jgi:pilus assembly protein CpaB
MGTRRLGVALAAALVISVIITSFFYIRISHAQAGASPKTKRVMAAAVQLQPGSPVTADKLTEINWPDNVPLDGLIEKKEDVVGHALIYAVAAHQPVLRRDLAAGSSLGLAARIPDGMRASAVKTNEVMNVAGFIFPGARVDVLVTVKAENNNSTTTRTVLQNVQVLSTGTKTDPDPSGKPENVTVVTLLVTPEDSEKLALAQNQGTIQFVLRNGGDSANSEMPGIDMANLTGTRREPVQPEPAKPKRVATVSKRSDVVPVAKQPTEYVVETVANGKVTTATFQLNAQ